MPKFLKNTTIVLLGAGIESYILALYGMAMPSLRPIKKAETKPERPKPTEPSGPIRPADIDWSANDEADLSFEDKLSKFKKDSDAKMLALKRSNDSKRSGGYRRGGGTY